MSGKVRERVLAAIARGDITKNRRGHRWWITEDEYRTLTAAELTHLKALVSAGAVRFETAGGYPNGWPVGGYCITPGGPLSRTGGES